MLKNKRNVTDLCEYGLYATVGGGLRLRGNGNAEAQPI